MKKTALQQLIEQLEEQYKSTPVFGIQYAIRAAKKKLETEREHIEEAYFQGHVQGNDRGLGDEFESKQYYKDTYQ